MLDGLLGRGFATKCKSLIKATKARIELIRRKRSARERFLKKDIADLIANGLDQNAYGRTEGLMTELTLSSCYDFVEEYCDTIYKHLSEMQKQSGMMKFSSDVCAGVMVKLEFASPNGECPAGCKEAVASLMFSAARVSDLPELRDLRETFQEKYGNSLQYSVNQKFVENLTSPAPTMEKKIHLMLDIAAEYSISWNHKTFEKQMSKPPVHSQTPQYGSVHQKEKKADGGNRTYQKDPILSKVNYEYYSNRNRSRPRNGNETAEEIGQSLTRQDDKAKGKTDDESKSLKEKEAHQLQNKVWGIPKTGPASRLGRSSYERKQDGFHKDHELQDSKASPSPKREMQQTLSHVRQVIHTPAERLEVQGNNKDSATNLPYARISLDADKLDARARSFNKMTPPPYVKPPKAVKAENGKDAAESSKAASQLPSISSNRTDEIRNGSHKSISEKESSCSRKGTGNRHDWIQITQNDSTSDPKPKSVRRHASRSSSGHDEPTGNHENGKIEKRSSSSSKKNDPKHGLQILFDDEPRVKDEEKVLDKLLIHLSTKPTKFDPQKLRRRSDVQAPRHMSTDAGDSRRPQAESKLKPGNVTPLAPHSRSVSLPHEQSVLPEPAKVFARAASFQPDRAAKHVHPNLPDFDDLAARMAALRGSY